MLRQTFHTRKTPLTTDNDLSGSLALERGYGDELHLKKQKKALFKLYFKMRKENELS